MTMGDLWRPATIKEVLGRHGFRFSKALGQNFLIDPRVCPRMAAESGAAECAGAIEVGPGLGVLTYELAQVAKKVVAIELDQRLFPVLGETLADCDYVVKIPMSHGVDSLNVAAASAVAFWELGRLAE